MTNPSNGATPHVAMTTTDGRHVTDLTSWPTRAEAANVFGVSVSSIRKWERAGKLHPIPDAEGTLRFQREEIEQLRAVRGVDATDGLEADSLEAAVELNLVGRMLALLTKPREVLDKLMIAELERTHARCAELEDKLLSAIAAREEALTDVSTRGTVTKILEAESNTKQAIMMRVVGKLENLLGPKGKPFLTALDAKKLEELAALPDYWSDGEKVALAAALEAKKALDTMTSSSSSSSTPTTEPDKKKPKE